MLALDTNGGTGIAFLVSAGIVFEIIAYSCSSPQTTEININERGDTLMKWVHIGQVQSVIFILVAAGIDKKHRVPILAGGVTAMGISEGLYMYAKQSGQRNPGPPTESYGYQYSLNGGNGGGY